MRPAQQDSANLAGKVAVVTGASRGIGRAIAASLAEGGATVGLVARDAQPLESVAVDLTNAYGVQLLALAADVSDAAQVEKLAARVENELGSVEILVNNCGIAVEGDFLEISQDAFDRVVSTNLRGTALCCRAFGAGLVRQGHGKVVNIASILGLSAVPQSSAYCASKAGVIGLTKALALEWANHNVQVNAIAPGYIKTEMNADARTDPERYEQMLDRIPANRFADPEDVGALVRFLVEPQASFITGDCVVIDGGQMARA